MLDQHTPPLPETKPSSAEARALLRALRDPREQRSRLVVTSVAVLVWLGIAWWLWAICGWVCAVLTLIGIGVFAGTIDALSPHMVRTQGIRVGPDQLPTLYHAVTQCAERLQLTAIPDVYVLHETVWNAMAIWLARRRVVVLYSAILDGILTDDSAHQQLTFLLGHEFGHHVDGHLDRMHLLVELACLWCPWLRRWHSRHCEATCDRIGLYCSDSLSASLRVVAKLMVGAHLAQEVNPDAVLRDWQQMKHERRIWRYIRSLEHFPLLCRYVELIEAAAVMEVLGLSVAKE